MIKKCEICGKEFQTIPYGGSRKYCFDCVPASLDEGQRTILQPKDEELIVKTFNEKKAIFLDKNSNIPEGWRKGRVILNKEKMDKFNKSLAERNRKEVIILNKITNTKETFRLDPIFFKVGNLLSYEKLLELHKSLGNWTNVCKFLKMGHKSIKKIKDFYISLGYLF